jgi:putative polyketide hydroxylase
MYQAIGRSDLEVEILTTGRWEMNALVSNSFCEGRVFLAGDAAHTFPPNRGGFGAKTGIEDAHNIAWKLSAVIANTSTPRLLDTYDTERRPIARLRHDQIFARDDYKAHAKDDGANAELIDDDAMEFGQLYRSPAVLESSTDLPPALRPELWSGQPGTRAPHLWISRAGRRMSTLDLFQNGWVLLVDYEDWRPAVVHSAACLGIHLECIQFGLDVNILDVEEFRSSFGLQAGGASLIRPDGYVAWRSSCFPADPAQVLTKSLRQVSFACR